MLRRMNKIGTLSLLLLFISTACSDFNKIVKSTDYEFKYKKAVEFYEKGEYSRASPCWLN
jgi:outer membrane protein assembly factor BamD